MFGWKVAGYLWESRDRKERMKSGFRSDDDGFYLEGCAGEFGGFGLDCGVYSHACEGSADDTAGEPEELFRCLLVLRFVGERKMRNLGNLEVGGFDIWYVQDGEVGLEDLRGAPGGKGVCDKTHIFRRGDGRYGDRKEIEQTYRLGSNYSLSSGFCTHLCEWSEGVVC